MSATLVQNRYGKSRVRVVKIKRTNELHTAHEITVQALLQGDGLDKSYTDGDNSMIVPTDTVKNTIYVLSKLHDVNPIEQFGVSIVQHFVKKYAHIHVAEVEIKQHFWDRMIKENGEPHPIGFVRREPEQRTCHVIMKRGEKPVVTSRIENLTVLKTTGNGFENFHKCEYTTLPSSADRLLCTAVMAEWKYNTLDVDYNAYYDTVKKTMTSIFADRYSRSVQEMEWDMGREVLARCPRIESIFFRAPNIHIFHFDIDRFGLKNNNEVYMPISEPSGYIEATVARVRSRL